MELINHVTCIYLTLTLVQRDTSHTAGLGRGSDGHKMGNDAGPIGFQENQPEDGHGVVDCLHVGWDVCLIAIKSFRKCQKPLSILLLFIPLLTPSFI